MERSNKKFDIKILTLVMLIMSLVLLVSGITFALYSNLLMGTTSNVINTGTLYFTYTEGDFVTNGIKIENAYPISDDIGKTLMGDNKYFDFVVNAETTIGDIDYEIVVLKEDDSTLQDKYVKIYLTDITSGMETPSDIVLNNGDVKTYEELESSTRQSGKIVYLGKVKNNTLNYQRKFRLRMWMSDNVTMEDDIFGKSFSVKVNVLGVQ